MLMSGYEVITDGGRRRHWTASEKLRIVEQTLDERASISVVARRNGVAANLLYRWRRLMVEGGSVAVTGDDDVTSNKLVRQMEQGIRELERHLGRKALVKAVHSLPTSAGPKFPSLGISGISRSEDRSSCVWVAYRAAFGVAAV